MQILNKWTFLLVVMLIFFTVSPTFASEDPEDAFTAIIESIENNDAKGFQDRVLNTYWEAVPLTSWNELERAMYQEFLAQALAESMTMLAQEEKSFELELSKMFRESGGSNSLYGDARQNWLETMDFLIRSGNFANMCRAVPNSQLPFTPEFLNSARISKASGDAKGLATATFTMLDGQEVVLALAELGDKWKVISYARNKKAATDKALLFLEELKKTEEIVAERKKNAKIFQTINQKQIEDGIRDIQNKEIVNAAKKLDISNNYILAMTNAEILLKSNTISLNPETFSDINDPEFWKLVVQELPTAFMHRKDIQNNSHQGLKKILESPDVEKIDEFITRFRDANTMIFGETLWQDGNFMLVKYNVPNKKMSELMQNIVKNNDKDKAEKLQNAWLNHNLYNYYDIEMYSLWQKIGDVWTVALNSAQVIASQQAYIYTPFSPSKKALAFNIQEYMIALAKRYPELQKQAEEIYQAKLLAEAEALKKLNEQMQSQMTAVSQAIMEAIEAKDVAKVFSLVDVNSFALAPKINVNEKELTEKKKQVAPTKAFELAFKKAIETGTALTSYEDIWDSNAWKSAEYAFLNSERQATIATLSTKNGKKYALFVTYNDSYKLILAPISDKTILEKNASAFINLWKKELANYKPDNAFQEVLLLADSLREKNGEKIREYIDIYSINAWEKYASRSNTNVLISQVDSELASLSEEELMKLQQEVAKNASFVLRNVKIDPTALETSSAIIANSNVLILADANKRHIFIFGKDNGKKLKAILPFSENSYEVKRLSDTYVNSEKNIARIREEREKLVASQTCVAAILDTLQIEDAQYSIFEQNGGLHVKAEMTIRNTHSAPMIVDNIGIYYIDKEGKEWRNLYFNAKNIAINAGQAIRVDPVWQISPDDMFLLQKVQQGDLQCFILPHKIRIGSDTFTRFDERAKVSRTSDGLWQLGNFPPVKAKVQRIIAEREKINAWKNDLKQVLEQNKLKSAELVGTFLDSFKVHYDSAKKEVIVTNHLDTKISPATIAFEVFDKNNILIQSKSFQLPINGAIEPKGSRAWKVNKDVASDESVRASIFRMQVENAKRNLPMERNKALLASGFVHPLLENNIQGTYKFANAHLEESIQEQSKETSSQTSTNESEKKVSEEAKEDASKAKEVDTTGLVLPDSKKPGTALIVETQEDIMGLNAFGADKKPDSCIRVLVKSPSPLIAVRLENTRGTVGSWKTKDVKTNAIGVLGVQKEGKLVNDKDASFSLDISSPTVLDLFVQDNGAIADTKTNLRVVLFHEDGSRMYAIIER